MAFEEFAHAAAEDAGAVLKQVPWPCRLGSWRAGLDGDRRMDAADDACATRGNAIEQPAHP